MLKKSLALFAGVAMTLSTAANAQTVAPGFTNLGSVPSCDDCSFPTRVSTGFGLNFFGNNYTGVFVNNNGNVTFNNTLSTFTPSALGATYTGQPIIAPFFADVDTNGTGTTTFGTGTYAGRNAFGVTWNAVGYFSSHTNLTNTFQLLLTDRSDVNAGDFDIYFNYNDINWETGDASGGSGGFGGVSAAAGFNSGTGSYYQVPGSFIHGALEDNGTNPLVNQTNDNVPGQYLFQVRSGRIEIPGGAVPEPATWAMMLVGFGAVGASMRRARHVQRLAAC